MSDPERPLFVFAGRSAAAAEQMLAAALAIVHISIARFSTLNLGVGVTDGTPARAILYGYALVCLVLAIHPTRPVHQVAAPVAAIVTIGRTLELAELVGDGRSDLIGALMLQASTVLFVVAFHAAGTVAIRQR